MDIFENPHCGTQLLPDAPMPIDDPAPVAALLSDCPAHAATPLVRADDLAAECGIAEVWVKDERPRMGLGSFKALGAAYVIATDAMMAGGDPATALAGRTFVTASAGNHGLSVAAGARVFGARAVVYLAATVPESFAARLRDKGAEVVRHGPDYAASMEGATTAAEENGWTLLSDISWPGYEDMPRLLMGGYLQLSAEVAEEIAAPPTHIFVQAGVGGMACAVAAHARRVWGEAPTIIVVEPDRAPALIESARAGRMVETTGADSNMGRLDCKEPSLIAFNGLARDADLFVTITDAQAEAAMPRLAAVGLETTPSGGAGLVALMDGTLDLPKDARVLCILSEGPD